MYSEILYTRELTKYYSRRMQFNLYFIIVVVIIILLVRDLSFYICIMYDVHYDDRTGLNKAFNIVYEIVVLEQNYYY